MGNNSFCQPTRLYSWPVWTAVWTLVFTVNLGISLPLGWATTAGGGRIGMLTGIAFIWGLGCAACLQRGRLRGALLSGSAVFAVSQVLPVIQIAAGQWALRSLFSTDPSDGAWYETETTMSETAGFVVTLLTAMPNLVLALCCGYGIRAVLDKGRADPSHVGTAANS